MKIYRASYPSKDPTIPISVGVKVWKSKTLHMNLLLTYKRQEQRINCVHTVLNSIEAKDLPESPGEIVLDRETLSKTKPMPLKLSTREHFRALCSLAELLAESPIQIFQEQSWVKASESLQAHLIETLMTFRIPKLKYLIIESLYDQFKNAGEDWLFARAEPLLYKYSEILRTMRKDLRQFSPFKYLSQLKLGEKLFFNLMSQRPLRMRFSEKVFRVSSKSLEGKFVLRQRYVPSEDSIKIGIAEGQIRNKKGPWIKLYNDEHFDRQLFMLFGYFCNLCLLDNLCPARGGSLTIEHYLSEIED